MEFQNVEPKNNLNDNSSYCSPLINPDCPLSNFHL